MGVHMQASRRVRWKERREEEQLDDVQKAHILLKIGQADHALCEGADEELQLLSIGAIMLKAISRKF